MKKLIFILLLLGIYINVFSQSYDVNYTVEYALKKVDGTEISRMKLFRNGNKMKFQKVDNRGAANETTTDIFIDKDERKIYQIIANSAGKFGSKYDLDISLVGMQTGVYILDLGNIDYILNDGNRTGTETVLGKECVKHTVASQSYGGETASSDYYIYQNNLMLKRTVGSSTEGNSIEALSYDTNIVPESVFVRPADVSWLN